jgi:uncharacterized hydrophobic protein (TIGR00271 family)
MQGWVFIMRQVVESIFLFLKERFDLQEDKAEESETIEAIKKGVEFRGTNLWILIFAIFIASIGLNVNSTAVIIGAMLISPLMGPIMGLGMGVGIYDFDLVQKSFKNLTIAVLISLLTSTIYFALTPLADAQSELLARTYPTIWDVFIAFLGGLAGIIAVTRRDKGNAIPGVAIATALMPPLCTAGYGLATGNFMFFMGAFYLFFINSVFISLSTFLIVRFLKFPKTSFVDAKAETKFKTYIYVIVFLTIVPSVYLGYNIVQKSVFENKVNQFLKNEISSNRHQIVNKNISFKKRQVDILCVGKNFKDEEIQLLKDKLKTLYVPDTELVVRQGLTETGTVDVSAIKSGILEEIYKKNLETLEDKDLEIQTLQEELAFLKKTNFSLEEIAEEIKAQYSDIEKIAISRANSIEFKESGKEEFTLVVVKAGKKMSKSEKKKFGQWLKARLKEEQVLVLFENF